MIKTNRNATRSFHEADNDNCSREMLKRRTKLVINAYGSARVNNDSCDYKTSFKEDHVVLETYSSNEQPDRVLQIFMHAKRDNGGYWFSVHIHGCSARPFRTNNLQDALKVFEAPHPEIKNSTLVLQ